MRFRNFLIAAGVIMLATGCAGYRLGPVNGQVAGAKSVEVAPFSNQTLEPRLTDAVTMQMRKQLQRDGTFRLATQEDGDILLSGVLTRYGRNELSFSRADTLTARDYRITLTAEVTARERSSGKILWSGPVIGRTLLRIGNDLPSAERQAMPLLAEDLAKNVTALLAEGLW
jgi:hypothetical protein